MWISDKVLDFFKISQLAFGQLQTEIAVLKNERDSLKEQLTRAALMQDFLRMQVNALQMERSSLMAKAYGINIPVPEIMRASGQPSSTSHPNPVKNEDFSFEDIGDEMAKRYGMPTYDPTPTTKVA